MNALRRYLELALHDAGRVEVRQLEPGKSPRFGLFDDLYALRDAVESLAAESTVYTTLNAPKLRPADNAMTGSALTDDDIGHIVRLPFDFDTVRPKKTNASDDEVLEALARRDRFVGAMKLHDFPMPLLAMSGNGAHALYRCRFPASEALREMLTAIYMVLKTDYSDERVRFDSTVRNPSRIWRIYGTVNRKHPATADRPHRVAECRIPVRWEYVSPQALVQFANACAKRNVRQEQVLPASASKITGSGAYRTLDPVAWFRAHGHYKRRLLGGKHAVICPWRQEHSDPDAGLEPMGTDTVVFDAEPGRWPAFHCSHDHCEGRRVIDVIALWRDADAYCARPYQREVV